MSEYLGEPNRFSCERWIAHGDEILRVNGLEAETVAKVSLPNDDHEYREAVARLIAAAPEICTFLARVAGIMTRYNQRLNPDYIEMPLQEIKNLLRVINDGRQNGKCHI